MHKKKRIFPILLAILLLSIANPTLVSLTKANPFPTPNTIGLIVLSPQNVSYSSSIISLNIGVIWTGAHGNVSYSLDNQATVDLALQPQTGSGNIDWSNSSLIGLQEGSHVLRVAVSNGYESKEKEVSFSIVLKSTSPTPSVPEFQMWTIPMLLTIMLAAGLLVYFKKHNR